MLAFRLTHQRQLDVVGLFLRQIDCQIGPNQCRSLTLAIVNHPAVGALAYQKSGRRKRLVAHSSVLFDGLSAAITGRLVASLIPASVGWLVCSAHDTSAATVRRSFSEHPRIGRSCVCCSSRRSRSSAICLDHERGRQLRRP